jgi:hypothetical protein
MTTKNGKKAETLLRDRYILLGTLSQAIGNRWMRLHQPYRAQRP